jgi:hypothetical protein
VAEEDVQFVAQFFGPLRCEQILERDMGLQGAVEGYVGIGHEGQSIERQEFGDLSESGPSRLQVGLEVFELPLKLRSVTCL